MEEEHGKQNLVAEDLKFIRSIVERTHREIDPGAPTLIMWGLLCLIGYTATHILMPYQMYRQINNVWLTLYAIGFPLSLFFGYKLYKREEIRGVRSHISRQIGWIWFIMIGNGILWGTFRFGGRFLGDINFWWALILGLALSMTGIVYSKEWLWAGIGVFFGMLAAIFIKPYTYLILGLATCLGCVIPSIIALRRLHRLEKEYEQG